MGGQFLSGPNRLLIWVSYFQDLMFLTLLMYLLPGTPLSRAKDHKSLDAVVIIPMAAAPIITIMTNVITVVPALLLVA